MAHRFNGKELAEMATELLETQKERDYYKAALFAEQVAHKLSITMQL